MGTRSGACAPACMASESVVDSQDMVLMARKFADSIMVVIRVQKLSMPGTGGEPRVPLLLFGKSDDAQGVLYLPAADGEAQKLRPRNRGRGGLLQGPCGHRLFPGRERLPSFSATRAPGYTAKAPLLGMMCSLVLKRSSRTGVASASFPGRKAIGWSFPRGR